MSLKHLRLKHAEDARDARDARDAEDARDFYQSHYSKFIETISIRSYAHSDDVSIKIILNNNYSEEVRSIKIDYDSPEEQNDAFCSMYSSEDISSSKQLFVDVDQDYDFFEEDISILNGEATSHKLFLTDFFDNISKFCFFTR